jgi:hypothetical protein
VTGLPDAAHLDGPWAGQATPPSRVPDNVHILCEHRCVWIAGATGRVTIDGSECLFAASQLSPTYHPIHVLNDGGSQQLLVTDNIFTFGWRGYTTRVQHCGPGERPDRQQPPTPVFRSASPNHSTASSARRRLRSARRTQRSSAT